MDLYNISLKNDCCKSHNGGKFAYTYEKYIEKYKNDQVSVLEIGVYYGASIKTWNDYFPNGKIYGVDLFTGVMGTANYTYDNPHKFLKEAKDQKYQRVTLIQADQSKREDLYRICDTVKEDLLFALDDGSHFCHDQIISLGVLFPKIMSNGMYFIEDLLDEAKGILQQYINTGKFSSHYLTTEEQDYLNKHIEYVKIYDFGPCITSIIKKKSI